jgi:hypothetical protein
VVPQEIAGLQLVDSVTGQEALQQIGRLHGKDFSLLDGFVAHYQTGSERATLWVAQARDTDQASQMVEDMSRRISEGNSPFTDPQGLDISGRILYSVSGQGQRHFYYQIADKVVWLAIDDGPKMAEAVHYLWQAIK